MTTIIPSPSKSKLSKLSIISFTSYYLPNLLIQQFTKCRKNIKSKSITNTNSQTHPTFHSNKDINNKSLIAYIDIFHTTHLHPITILSAKVFLFSIIYHLVEEKTSKQIAGFQYSWYITYFELSCAFLLELMERLSVMYNNDPCVEHMHYTSSENEINLENETDNECIPFLPSNYDTNEIEIEMENENNVQFCSFPLHCFFGETFRWSYIFLALNLVISRGLATVVLQYYDMDYPTYAICRNSKMVFIMILSILWLHKSYQISDWFLVALTTIAVLCFRLASQSTWVSSVNTMGVPVLLVSTFLSAMDNSWKEKVMSNTKNNISPNEILFHINFFAVVMLFIYTLISHEFQNATAFVFEHPSTLLWMIIRGISYALWIHFSVVLIQQAGALVNQYVSAGRKLFSVFLSFVMFGKSFYFFHGIGFFFFMIACLLKVHIITSSKKSMVSELNEENVDDVQIENIGGVKKISKKMDLSMGNLSACNRNLKKTLDVSMNMNGVSYISCTSSSNCVSSGISDDSARSDSLFLRSSGNSAIMMESTISLMNIKSSSVISVSISS